MAAQLNAALQLALTTFIPSHLARATPLLLVRLQLSSTMIVLFCGSVEGEQSTGHSHTEQALTMVSMVLEVGPYNIQHHEVCQQILPGWFYLI